MTTAKQLLQEFIADRTREQHEACALLFISKLDSLDADAPLPAREFMGPLAALLADHMRSKVTPKLSRVGRSMTEDALGNRQYRVDLSDEVPVITRAG